MLHLIDHSIDPCRLRPVRLGVEKTEILGKSALWLGCLAAIWLSEFSARADAHACTQAHTQAQVLGKQGDLLLAREQMLRCARADCPDLIVEDCAGWLPAMESRIPTAVFAVSDSEGRDVTEVTVTDQNGRVITTQADGHAVELDPGMYEFRVEAQGYAIYQQRVVLRESEKTRIVRIALRPTEPRAPPAQSEPEPNRSIPLASYILAGAALVGGGMFAYFGLRSNSFASEFDDLHCADAATRRSEGLEPRCSNLESRGELYSNVANVSLGLGLASLGTAVLVYALTPPSPGEQDPGIASLEPVPGGVMFRLTGQF